MYSSIKFLLLTLLISFFSINSFSQSDTSKVAKKIKKIDNEINAKKSSNKLKAKSPTAKVNSNPDFEIGKKVNPDAIDKKLKQTKSKNNQTFLLETLPEDRDILGKRYWKGKDVTHKKLESHFSLGTVNSTSKTVKIECRDYSLVDGDRIRIYLNERPVSTNIGLKANYYVLYLDLEPGYNRIDFQALNMGYSGPNTAELNVYDDKGTLISSKEWSLPTGYIATLGIIKK